MSFRYTDDLRAHYFTYGYAVFRQIVPPALVEDLRRASDGARVVAREVGGPQAQRLEPIWEHDIELGPFWAFSELPELRDALAQLLSPEHIHGVPKAILFEPAEHAYTLPWHRDWGEIVSREEWLKVLHDLDYLNQINAPLYEDTSLWVVPGSQYREELAAERAALAEGLLPAPGGTRDELSRNWSQEPFEGLSEAEREQRGLAYCARMPGAVCLPLGPGDVAIYRNALWHTGTYVPYKKRATMHGYIDTPAFGTWRQQVGGDRLGYKSYLEGVGR
jgi:hypothetical protein